LHAFKKISIQLIPRFSGEIHMKSPVRGKLLLLAAFALMVAPAYAGVQVNDRSEIALTVFVPCAADGAGEVVDLAGPLHTLIINAFPARSIRPGTVDKNNIPNAMLLVLRREGARCQQQL
jgi:hypothetical protein